MPVEVPWRDGGSPCYPGTLAVVPGESRSPMIEEVEWSGRPCNDLDRLADLCNGGSNRENNTVYGPRWAAWIQLLEYVRDYEGGVAMTMGEVALAKAFDNAPTVYNPDQADNDHAGFGDDRRGLGGGPDPRVGPAVLGGDPPARRRRPLRLQLRAGGAR